MTRQNTLDHTVLASLLEPLEDSEGILVCCNEFPFRDEDSTKRLFGTFQFTEVEGLDGGQHYRYMDSGVVICHTGPSINILIGGEVPEAVPDLMRAIDQLGWRTVDVYARHGQAFFDDIARHMPASVDLDIALQEVPVELSDDLTDFAREAAAEGNVDYADVETNFMNMLRSESGLPSSPAPSLALAAVPAEQTESVNVGMGMAVGVAHNYVPDAVLDDFAPTIPMPIPSAEEQPAQAGPVASPAKPQAASVRPVISLATASPVVAPQGRHQAESAAIPAKPAPTVVSEQQVNSTEPARSMDKQPAQTLRMAETTPEMRPPCPTPISGVRHQFDSRISPPEFPDEPISLGDSLVVVCLSERFCSEADLQELAAGRDVVIFEPGAVKLSDRHVSWNMIDEPAGLDLVAALWPYAKEDHLAVHAMLTLARLQPAPHSLSGLLALAKQDIESEIFPQLAAAQIDPQVMEYLRMQHRLGLMSVALWRMVVDLCSAAELERLHQSIARVSFSALAARQVKPLLVVVRLDALDSGSAAEFLAAGALRWVSRLANSRRAMMMPVPDELLSEAESLVSKMTPELLSLVQKLVNARV